MSLLVGMGKGQLREHDSRSAFCFGFGPVFGHQRINVI